MGRGAREVLLCAKGDRTLPGVFGEDAGAALGAWMGPLVRDGKWRGL